MSSNVTKAIKKANKQIEAALEELEVTMRLEIMRELKRKAIKCGKTYEYSNGMGIVTCGYDDKDFFLDSEDPLFLTSLRTFRRQAAECDNMHIARMENFNLLPYCRIRAFADGTVKVD